MQPKRTDTTDADTDLSGLLDTLRRNIKKIALATLLGFGLALAYLTIAKPVYTATASLFMDPRSRKVVSDELYQGDPTSALALVDSQMSIITSDTVLRRVVDKLNLDERPEFTVQPGPGFIYKIKSLISPQPAVPAREPSVQAIQTLNEGIKVKRAQKTYVVDIEASAATPELARDIAQAVADAYLEDQRDAKSAQAKEANGLIDGRLEEMREQVSAAEAAVDRFKKEKNILTSEGGIVTEQQLTRINQEMITARAVAAEARARRDQIQAALKSGGADVIPDAMRSGLIQRLREQYAQVARREAALASQLQPKHPVLIDVRSQLAEVKAQINAELKRVATVAQSEYDVASNRERDLVQQLERAKGEVERSNTDQIRLRDLEQDANASRELLRVFLSRAKETQEQQNVAIADARIVTSPSLPAKPARPIGWLILGLGLLGGLGLGLASALIADHMDRTMRRPGDFAGHVDTSAVSWIPNLYANRSILGALRWPVNGMASSTGSIDAAQFSDLLNALSDYKKSGNTAATEFRQSVLRILSRIKTHQRPGQPLTIMLAAPTLKAGNSATALALAYSAAQSGERVLLIDATSSDPALSATFATSLAPQNVIVLDNKEHLARITTRDARTGLAFLPIALADLRTLKVQQRRRLAAGLQGLIQRYDLIFIDAGGVLDDESSSCLLPIVDQAILVARSGLTTKDQIDAMVEALEPAGLRPSGAILTMTDY
jgi:uncharacterized protein involved in exopolysaccharide biosynthesis/Mrp family chromosome partitioning ATPase